MLSDFYADRWKEKSFIFKIKVWLKNEKKYEEVLLTINEETRALFLNATGLYNCPYAKNNEYGNWLRIQYWWPPQKNEDMDKMKVVVSKKPLITYKDIDVSREIHDTSCLYVQKDNENDISFFTSFIDTHKF